MSMSRRGSECRREGCVSVWIGTFPSVGAAELYFGIPDEIGVYLPPDGFANDLGLDELPADSLEVNFERILPRSLGELLNDATFSQTFREQAIEAARQQGVSNAQGIALLYDFDYQAKPDWQRSAGQMTFIGVFGFGRTPGVDDLTPRRDPTIEIRQVADDVL
jgi:hypothetical protein